ncbi:M28 family metallopeptidase [Aquimarina sp. 2201CG5-10]|uniref:M28 family metallopeptidase n=1 Tax=Aquimarina callyspongiae TaxID=3098150 RepID=UPI002AB4DE75|nr:M28 family metallopeptidase [Aquimarina sp. 2201CG5-10]MDY8135891.1 M28 family metallopeptidase [Aquimarina sp. 2201CG5-10]
MKKLLSFIAIILFIAACGTTKKTTTQATKSPEKTGKPETYANTITASDLKEALYVYASDDFEGRETGQPGQKKAINFLKDHYKSFGVSAAKSDGDYFQTVPLDVIKAPDVSLTINGESFNYLDDLVSITSGETGELSADEIVYAGFGIEDEKFSSYTDIDVKDKIVLFKSGEPKKEDGTYIISGTSEPSNWSKMQQQFVAKRDAAISKGAKAVLFYFPEVYQMAVRRFGASSGAMTLAGGEKEAHFFLVNEKVVKSLVSDIATNNTSSNIKTKFKLGYKSNIEKVTSENVAAFIKGSEKPNEIIVISAHLDHEGVKDGQVYNGADDDGSGTVAVVEIAEAFAKAVKDGNGPKRSILFLNVTGEEKGLLGSRYYTDMDPIFPLEQTVANLNIDMIGRIDPERKKGNRNYVYLIGSDKLSTELHNISEEVNTKYMNIDLDYTFNDENDPNRFYYRSDHYNFAKNNIPVIFYFNGTHKDYHQPSDTPDKIEYDLLENRARLVFYTAWELANRENRIVVDKATSN